MISFERTRCVARAICMHAFVTCVIEPQEKIKYSSFQWTLVFYLSLTHAKVSVSLNSVCQVMIWIAIHWQLIGSLHTLATHWGSISKSSNVKEENQCAIIIALPIHQKHRINKFILQKKTHKNAHIHFYVRYSCLLSANLAK